jgi:hypothetical protein
MKGLAPLKKKGANCANVCAYPISGIVIRPLQVYKAPIMVEIALGFAIYTLAPSPAFQVLFTRETLGGCVVK